MLVGLKSDISGEEILYRKKHSPPCYEFYVRKTDSTKKIQEAIDKVKEFADHVVIHQPTDYDYQTHTRINEKLCEKCVRIAEKNDLHGVVVHPLKTKEQTIELWRNLDSDEVMVENLTHDYFRTKEEMINSPFPRLVFDVCHAFMVCKDNDYLMNWVKSVEDRIAWYHFADSDGRTHGAPIGEGSIDWKRVMRLNGRGVVEVSEADEILGPKKVDGYSKLNQIIGEVLS